MDDQEYSNDAQDVKEGIVALLDCAETEPSFHNETAVLERRQGDLCASLLKSLRRLQAAKGIKSPSSKADDPVELEQPSVFIRTSIVDYNNKSVTQGKSTSNFSIRDAFGNLPSATTSQIAPVLTSLLGNRVDAADLLPATQDILANEEAMGMAAVTITKLGFEAAQLYAELIGMFGAWGAGLIDVGAISSLSALLRRWCVECRGRESKDVNNKKEDNNKRKSTQKARPIKRSKKKSSRRIIIDELDDDDEGVSDNDDASLELEDDSLENGMFVVECEEGGAGSPLTPEQLMMGGLRVALTLSRVPCQKEFMNWSADAREALLDTIVTALATTSALMSSFSKAQPSKHENETKTMGRLVVSSLTQALQNCVFASEIDDVDSPANKNKAHETSVFILRGLLPITSMQMELPNGQTGKEAANEAAVTVLEGFIRCIAEECSKWSIQASSRTPSSRTTPKSNGKDIFSETPQNGSFTEASTPKTGTKQRRKRVSFGGNTNDEDSIAPPTLKKSVTPRRSRSHTPAQLASQPRPILSAALGMLQKLATSKGLERAGVRARTVATVHRCLPHFPAKERSHFLRFTIQLCHSKVSIHRLIGSEIIGMALSEEWLWKEHANHSGSSPLVFKLVSTPRSTPKMSPLGQSSMENMPFALLGVLHGRLTDKVPAVRARAAFSLAKTFRDISEGVLMLKPGDKAWAAFEESIDAIANNLLVALRKRAALDDRATVKRGAMSALVELLILGETLIFKGNNRLCITETDVSIFARLCGDNSVSTRKYAAEAISNLLKKCCYNSHCSIETADMLERAWSSSVLPLVRDVENTCATKVVDIFSSIVIQPLVEVGGSEIVLEDPVAYRRYLTAWRILAHGSESSRMEGAARGEAGSLRAALKKQFAESGSSEKDMARSLLKEIRKVAVNTLKSEEDIDENMQDLFHGNIEAQRIGVWCLLDAFVDCQKELRHIAQVIKCSSVDMQFLATSWEAMLQLSLSTETPDHCKTGLGGTMRYSLRVLSMLAPLVPVQEATVSAERLERLLRNFLLSPDLIGPAVLALGALTTQCSTPTLAKEACSDWIRRLYTSCENSLTSYISTNTPETLVVRSLFTVGELSMIGFRSGEDAQSMKSTIVDDPIAGIYERPSRLLLNLLQSLLSKHLPSSGTTEVETRLTPEPVRAHAFSALGKLCLRDEGLAKSCLTIIARELHESTSDMNFSVQSNALLVFGDLCVKYTNLVDRYLPVMAACLQSGSSVGNAINLRDSQLDGSALVRKHAILMLSSLLLQDYIKWRGLLFHRFLVASADNDEGVAKLAEMTLCGPLLSRYPKLFFNNFVESVFVLNRCTAHPIYAVAASSGESGAGIAVGFDGINLRSSLGRICKLRMYELMLSNMSDEEKIGITARLAKEVLGGALKSDGDLGRVCRMPPRVILPSEESNDMSPRKDRDESAFNVLSDAFAILTSPSLRVCKVGVNSEDEIEDTDHKPVQVAVAAKGRLLSKISRKHLIEIVLPILCSLKVILQDSCSPLLKDLMRYIVELFRVYKTEVKEFLASDPTLLQEVEYDARQFRKSQKMETPQRELVVAVRE